MNIDEKLQEAGIPEGFVYSTALEIARKTPSITESGFVLCLSILPGLTASITSMDVRTVGFARLARLNRLKENPFENRNNRATRNNTNPFAEVFEPWKYEITPQLIKHLNRMIGSGMKDRDGFFNMLMQHHLSTKVAMAITTIINEPLERDNIQSLINTMPDIRMCLPQILWG